MTRATWTGLVLVLALAAMAWGAGSAPAHDDTGSCSAGGASPTRASLVPTPPDDQDCDYVKDDVDNCKPRWENDFASRNPDQTNSDDDEFGDRCDEDDDNDTVRDDVPDNCRTVPNPLQEDNDGNNDGDGIGDACEFDSDGDGLDDPADNCPSLANPDQKDSDLDKLGDACDNDDDEDYVLDADDNCPLRPNPPPDTGQPQPDGDGDGIGTECDPDESSLGTGTPAPAPTPGPPVAAGAARDQQAPSVRIGVARRHRFAELGGGLAVGIRCSEACAVRADLRLSAKQARRLRLSRIRVVARGSARLDGAGRTYAFLRFDRRAWRRLSRARRAAVQLRIVAVDRAGNRSTRRTTLTLRR